MRGIRFVPHTLGVAVGLLLVFLSWPATTTARAASGDAATASFLPPDEEAILLLPFPFACQMVDEGGSGQAFVYCWSGSGVPGKRHIKLDVEGNFSLTASSRIPFGLGGPGAPFGAWKTVGRFRCEVLRKGVECVAVASGRGFLMTRTKIVAVQQPPGVTEPAPVLGQSANLKPVSGGVLIKEPGKSFFRVLNMNARLPLGTAVDTSRGTIELTTAAGPAGETQTGRFHAGKFRITQPRSQSRSAGLPEGLTVLSLAGALPACGTRGRGAVASSQKKGRRLWGDAHGDFQTGGRYASATVSGTKWLTEDTCAGTLVKVARGVVTVNDLLHHRTILVKAPGSFLAHPGPSGPSKNGASSHAPLWTALDGKVICGLSAHAPQSPGELLCDARPVPAPKNTTNADGDPGFVFLGSTGSPQLARLSGYSWESEGGLGTAGPLAAGKKWSSGAINVTCAIGATAVRCANGSGHGFRITKSSYRAF